MKESRKYLQFVRKQLLVLGVGLLLGVVVGIGIVNLGGRKFVGYSSLELVADEAHVRERALMVEAAVTWGREVAIERGWVKSGNMVRVYKDGPLVVKVEVEGSDPTVVEMNRRVNQEMIAKYGFGILVDTKLIVTQKYSTLLVVFGGGVGVLVALGLVLVREYWQNY